MPAFDFLNCRWKSRGEGRVANGCSYQVTEPQFFGLVSSEGVRRLRGADKATGVKWCAVFTWYQAGQEGDKMITRNLRRQGRVWRLLPAAKWTSALATHTVNKFLSFYSPPLIIYMIYFFSYVVYGRNFISLNARRESETWLRNLI